MRKSRIRLPFGLLHALLDYGLLEKFLAGVEDYHTAPLSMGVSLRLNIRNMNDAFHWRGSPFPEEDWVGVAGCSYLPGGSPSEVNCIINIIDANYSKPEVRVEDAENFPDQVDFLLNHPAFHRKVDPVLEIEWE